MRPEVLFPLFRSVNTLKGIGPRMAAFVEKLAGEHVLDLSWHLPSGLVTRKKVDSLGPELSAQQIVVNIKVLEHTPARNRRHPYRISCEVGDEVLTLIFFNGREQYLKQKLPIGQIRLIAGKLEQYAGEYQITHPDHILRLDEKDIIPIHEAVYPLTAGITNNAITKAIRQSLEILPDLPEWQDKALLKREKWDNWLLCIKKVHKPEDEADLEPLTSVRSRLAYDELLANQLALELVRRSYEEKTGALS